MPLSPSHLVPRRRATPTLHGRGVLFSVHGTRYALEAARVKHVLRDEGGGGAEIVFLGVPYPVIDLRLLLGFPAWDGPVGGPRGRVALLVAGVGLSGALLADVVVTLIALPSSAISALPDGYAAPERPWLRGLARLEDRDVPLFDVDALLASRLERRHA
jgi:chemotaxis signal transduction protein